MNAKMGVHRFRLRTLIPSQEAIQALRDAEEEMSRVLASNPCVRLLAEAARGLPAGPAGPPLLGFFSRMEAGE